MKSEEPKDTGDVFDTLLGHIAGYGITLALIFGLAGPLWGLVGAVVGAALGAVAHKYVSRYEDWKAPKRHHKD